MKKFCPVYSYADSIFAVQREKENTARVINNFKYFKLIRLLYGEILILLIVIH